ncbi:unnamed protein product [Pedinophyceae sp. YPF-701]|nr:unnamed protein product [Pedinophyceae sp. YPF-701]
MRPHGHLKRIGLSESESEDVGRKFTGATQENARLDNEDVASVRSATLEAAFDDAVAADPHFPLPVGLDPTSIFPPGGVNDCISIMLPAYRETEEELRLSLLSYTVDNIPDTDMRNVLELYVVLDGHSPDQPEDDNPTLSAVKHLLFAGATSEVQRVDHPYFRLYRGRYHGVPFGLYIKSPRLRRGKRFSQILLVELLRVRADLLGISPFALLSCDADTYVTGWSLHVLREALVANPSHAAVSGQILPDNIRWKWGLFWPKQQTVFSQYMEYSFSSIIDKAFQAAFGSVLVLPGAFSLLRFSALNDVWAAYSTRTRQGQLLSINCLDLGEDRYLTTLLLMAGHSTGYVESAMAFTNVPDDWTALAVQRRRWYNSTVANYLLMIVNWRCLARFKRGQFVVYFFLCFDFLAGLLQPAIILAMISTVEIPAAFLPGALDGNAYFRGFRTFDRLAWFGEVRAGCLGWLLGSAWMLWGALSARRPDFHRSSGMWVWLLPIFAAYMWALASNIWWTLEFASRAAQALMLVVPCALLGVMVLRSRLAQWSKLVASTALVYVLHMPFYAVFVPLYGIANFNNGTWGTREAESGDVRRSVAEQEAAAVEAERELLEHVIDTELRAEELIDHAAETRVVADRSPGGHFYGSDAIGSPGPAYAMSPSWAAPTPLTAQPVLARATDAFTRLRQSQSGTPGRMLHVKPFTPSNVDIELAYQVASLAALGGLIPDGGDENEQRPLLAGRGHGDFAGFVRCLADLPPHVALAEVAAEPGILVDGSHAAAFRQFVAGWRKPIPPAAPFWPIDLLARHVRTWTLTERRDALLAAWLVFVVFSGLGFVVWKIQAVEAAERTRDIERLQGRPIGEEASAGDLLGPLVLMSVYGPLPALIKIVVSFAWAAWNGQFWCCWISRAAAMDRMSMQAKERAANARAHDTYMATRAGQPRDGSKRPQTAAGDLRRRAALDAPSQV